MLNSYSTLHNFIKVSTTLQCSTLLCYSKNILLASFNKIEMYLYFLTCFALTILLKYKETKRTKNI